MKILLNNNDLNEALENVSNLGFVPTMGSLHKGHISLIKQSKKKCNKTIVSIFVNPKQFNNKNDFKKYPRNRKKDLSILKRLKVNYVYLPTVKEIYRVMRSSKIIISKKDKILCAKYRKGHFVGVIDVMERLIEYIKPQKIFMGEKDFQQLRIIENLVFEKKINTKVIRCETLRDSDGLALSSRNSKLSFSSKKMATNLFKALNFAKEKFNTLDVVEIEKKIIEQMTAHSEIKLDYFIIADEEKLEPSILKNNQKYRAFIAAYISGVRLIDNIKLY